MNIAEELENIGDVRFKAGFFETLLYIVYKDWIVKPGSVAIDIGAHKGLHTFRLAERVGPRGKVIAFEPLGALAHDLTLEASERFADGRIEVRQEAVSNFSGEADFYENVEASSQSTLVLEHDLNGAEKKVCKTRVTTLDDALMDIKTNFISFVKIDAESAEYFILEGAKATFQRASPVLAIELWTSFTDGSRTDTMQNIGRPLSDFFDLADEIGYNFYNLDGTAFDRDNYDTKFACYERIGVKKGHHTENFVKTVMPDLVKNYLQKHRDQNTK